MSRREQREPGTLTYGAIPRAALMPPEVELRRKESSRRRGLLGAAVAVVVITIAGVVGSFWVAAVAEAQLAEERRLTEQLLATQAEFAEVLQVQRQLQSISGVRTQLAGVEVFWRDSLTPYLSVFAAGEVVDSLTLEGEAPAEPVLGLTGPLRAPRVATVTMVIVTAESPQPQLWYRAWEQIETYADASIDSITLLQDVFETRVTINLSDGALSQRFSTEGESE